MTCQHYTVTRAATDNILGTGRPGHVAVQLIAEPGADLDAGCGRSKTRRPQI
jgi:hypothetical protein